jgi:hypothetical protein
MRYALLLALAAFLPLSVPAAADPISDSVAALPGAIEEVKIAGTWQKGDKSGPYRIVISRSGGDSVTARLFVQWIAYQEDGGATVDSTTEIKELADLKLDIVSFESESDEDGLAVYLETIDPNGDKDGSYELHVLSPAEYRFGPATN